MRTSLPAILRWCDFLHVRNVGAVRPLQAHAQRITSPAENGDGVVDVEHNSYQGYILHLLLLLLLSLLVLMFSFIFLSLLLRRIITF